MMMGRRWIMVELGEHCHTHIIPRLKKVIDGEDSGGITAAVGWKGGGGFRYYRLAPSLLAQDKWGNWVINREYWKGKKKTPTKLPGEIVRKILFYSSNPGDIVLDPFLGSGTVAAVCRENGRHYLGFELVEDYYRFASERISNDKSLAMRKKCQGMPGKKKRTDHENAEGEI